MNAKRTIFSIWIMVMSLTPYLLFAQKMEGLVIDQAGEPLPYVAVALYQQTDSQLVKGNVTDEQGRFLFEDIPADRFYIEYSMLGYASVIQRDIKYAGNNLDLGTISLGTQAQELDAVTVKAKKPLITVSAERMVLNVADNISTTGDNGLELLRKAPGVVVDNNNNISLRGNAGVEIYIDGKRTQMSSEDIAAMLRNYDANSIEAIEIISNPSAKYEAEGNAGIINIRLKKNKNYGWNGSVNGTFIQGHTPKGNGGISLNYRNNGVNFYNTLSGRMGYWHNQNQFYREQGPAYFDQIINQISDSMPYPAFTVKMGVDYQISDRHTVGAQVNLNVSEQVWRSVNTTDIGQIGSPPDSILEARSRISADRSNLQTNVNYRFDISKEESFSLDLDYGRFRNESYNYQPNDYVTPTEKDLLSQRIFGNQTETYIDIYTIKADYESKLWKGTLALGMKYSNVSTDNNFDFKASDGGPLQPNPSLSSEFTYDERVTAGYINYNRLVAENISLQAGLRMEHTYSRGLLSQLVPSPNDDIERRYTNFFPSASISWQYHPKFSTSLNYSRRINRPNYQDLNPFEIRASELTFRKGNPFLNPQYTNSLSLNQTLFGFAQLSVGYTRTDDFFGQIIDSLDAKRNFITQENIAVFDNYTLSISTPLPLADWYAGFISITGFHQQYKSDYGEGNILSIKTNGFNLYSQHTFTLFKDWKFQLSGWYNYGGVWGGTFKNGGQGAMDVGLQRSFFDNNLQINVSVTDVLQTAGWNAVSDFNGIFFRGRGRWEATTFRLSASYRFGNSSGNARRNRKTGLEEEANRIKTSS